MKYRLIERDECGYCGGSGACYPCSGEGHTGDEPCVECDTSGVCQECAGGSEMWLVFTPVALYTGRGSALPNGERGSMLRRHEIDDWERNGTPPDWYEAYHGLTVSA